VEILHRLIAVSHAAVAQNCWKGEYYHVEIREGDKEAGNNVIYSMYTVQHSKSARFVFEYNAFENSESRFRFCIHNISDSIAWIFLINIKNVM
jgi:hypothetical protein